MVVTFCGHGKYVYGEDVKNRLKEEAEKLINQGADLFYLGGYGRFDGLATQVLTELKETYPHIRRVLVIPYLNRDYYTKNYDETLYPPIENVHLGFAYQKEMNGWLKIPKCLFVLSKTPSAEHITHISVQKDVKKP